MTTTVTVGTDRLTIDVDPWTGITVTTTSPNRAAWVQQCDSLALALGVVADEVVRISAERFGTETSTAAGKPRS